MSISSAMGTGPAVERARDTALPLHERHDAFAELVGRSQRLVLHWALSSLRNEDEAKDAAQEAFTTAWFCLPHLRDPSAFTGWLKRIVATQCHRRLRCAAPARAVPDPPGVAASEGDRGEYRPLLASAIAGLPEGERLVVLLTFFLGYTQEEVSRLTGLKPGTVGKRLFSARLRIRRRLPSSVRREFVPLVRTRGFIRDVRRGVFDGYTGEYRFDRRPGLVVTITRQGDRLIGEAAGQRNLLLWAGGESLVTSNYDGTGIFHRNRRGDVTHFVYYEFGRRLGIARRIRRRGGSGRRRGGTEGASTRRPGGAGAGRKSRGGPGSRPAHGSGA
jgi:RNA polymerase sigma-70 factor (ECF subfamily)